MNVLVTGGAGFIGSHIVSELVARKESVRVLDNFSTGDPQNLAGLDVEVIEGDITDLSTVQRATAGMTHVIHQAALISVPDSLANPVKCHQVNVTGTLNVLMAARDANVRRVVFASSTAVYGDTTSSPLRESMPLAPKSPYGASKLAAEAYLSAFYHSFGLETVALRYFNVFGPRQRPDSPYAAVIPQFASALLAGDRITIFGDGRQTRDFVHVSNVAEANILALTNSGAAGRVFNIARGIPVSINQLVVALNNILGTKAVPIYAEPRDGDILHSRADISRAVKVLGYRPDVTLEDGLSLTLRWHQGQHYAHA